MRCLARELGPTNNCAHAASAALIARHRGVSASRGITRETQGEASRGGMAGERPFVPARGHRRAGAHARHMCAARKLRSSKSMAPSAVLWSCMPGTDRDRPSPRSRLSGQQCACACTPSTRARSRLSSARRGTSTRELAELLCTD